MTIILDLDDVLANLRESLYQALQRATGVDTHWRDWKHYDLTQYYAIEADALHDIIRQERALESCQPEPDAAATTEKLAEMGFEIAIITARGWHSGALELTREWLEQHRIHHDHLTIVPLGGNKLEALKPFPNIAFAVDDHPNNVKRYESIDISTLMMDMPWNAEHQSKKRIYSLEAVLDHASEIITDQ